MTHHPAGNGTGSHYPPDIIGVNGPLSFYQRDSSGKKTKKELKEMVSEDTGKSQRKDRFMPEPEDNLADPDVPVAGTVKEQEEPKYWPIPYPMARTIVEMKTERYRGLNQGITYSWYVLEASPHISGMYILAARPQDYQLAWVDASGPVCSSDFSWDVLEPLVQTIVG